MLAVLLGCLQAYAHDFWLHPESFQVEPGGEARLVLLVGDDLRVEEWQPHRPDRATRVEWWGPSGRGAPTVGEGGLGAAFLLGATPQPGDYLLVLERAVTEIELAPEVFARYVQEEHLPHPLPPPGKPGAAQRETYDRSLKVLVHAGPGGGSGLAAQVTGMPLDLLLLDDPRQLRGDRLRVAALLEGEPLADHRLELLQRAGPQGPLVERVAQTGPDGVAHFEGVGPGAWLARTVWSTGCTGCPDADWRSHWASFAFEVAEARP